MKARYWTGDVPERDDFGEPIHGEFVDGATMQGPWAIMGLASFMSHGVGLGQGRGQHYKKMKDGRWLKVEG